MIFHNHGSENDSAFFDKRSKFIHYLPELAIVNNMEFDHADIFDDLDAVKKSFGHMIRLVPENGIVLLNGDDQNCLDVFADQGHSPMKLIFSSMDVTLVRARLDKKQRNCSQN